MASVAKVAGGGAAVVGGGGAVGYGVKYALEMEPSSTILALAADFSSAYTSDKYGNTGDNKNSFIDPDKNEKWWDWVHKYFFKPDKDRDSESIHESFYSVIKGYSGESGTDSLNQVCKTAFKKHPKEVTNIKYKTNIWTYCSKGRKAPSNIKDMPKAYVLKDSESSTHSITGSNKLGLVDGNKSLLISDIAQNEEAWNWIYENKLNVDKGNNSKSSDIDTNFNSVTKAYASSSDNSALNQVCKAAYEKGSSDLSGDDSKNKYKKNIELYCTKGETTLTLPSS